MPLSLLRTRTSVVFSHQAKPSLDADIECTFVNSLEEFLSRMSRWKNQKIFMMGDSRIAHLFLKH